MARKYWERVGGNQIRFYDEPLDLKKDEVDDRIAELQAILALPDNIKELLAQANPGIEDEAAFDQIFEDEIEQLADQRDYWDMDQIVENITVVETGFWSPSAAALGPGTIESVSSEQVGFEAIQAIDGVNGTEWQTDALGGPHEIVFGWGYKKRFDGIRWRVGAAVGNPQAWEGVSIWIANGLNGLDDPGNLALDNVDIAVVGTLTDPWLEVDFPAKESGRYCRIVITGTGRGDNRADAGEIELRQNTRTTGL